jgi:hypothetical protein
MNDPAPGAGSWSATKEAGQTQGCFPSYLFQRLTGVADGQVMNLTGWVRCDLAPICPGAWFGLGVVNSGSFHLEEQAGTSAVIWSYFSFTDTVEIGAGDTAILVLTSGLVGGPAFPAPGHFDGMSVDLSTGLGHADDWTVHHRFDPQDHRLTIATGGPAISELRCSDATGRDVPAALDWIDRSQVSLHTFDLGTGVYVVRVTAGDIDRVVRFVNP